jgi:hypothetical protein
MPYLIKGELVTPKETVKILGVTMDTQLRYKQHIAATVTKGLLAALALKRLHLISPSNTRRLFATTIAPVIDYASNVWGHACGDKGIALINRAQRVGAQAITGAFRTVATAVAEAEAHIQSVHTRHQYRAAKLWITIATLSKTNPITRICTKERRGFKSPLQRIANNYQEIPTDRAKTILPYCIAPWEKRLSITSRSGLEPPRTRALHRHKRIRERWDNWDRMDSL